MAATLRRCSSYGYDAAVLQLTWLRRCGVVIRAFFFVLDDSWQVQESSTSLPVCARKGETKSKKEQERALKPVLVLLFQALPLSSDPSLVC